MFTLRNYKPTQQPVPVKVPVPVQEKAQVQVQDPKCNTFYKLHAYAAKPSTSSVLNFPPQYFSGSQLLNLYNIQKVIAKTRKVKIAIIIAFTYSGLKADLNTYWKNSINFGAESTPPVINVYTMKGATFNAGWAQEECLDVQMVATMNPNATIWVVEAASDNINDLMSAVDYANNTIQADVISMSWGGNDVASNTSSNSYFTNPSISYCAASGDTNSVSWPAVLSNCIAVGGSTLLWTPTSNNTNTRTEYSWNGAGCGYSSTVLQPEYQKDVKTISHKYRVIPDVSLIANPSTCVYTVYDGNWYGIGGTSVATPIFAAMMSLANQMRFNAGKGPLTSVFDKTPANNIQNYLYKTIYTNPASYAADFYNITIGTGKGSVGGTSSALTTYTANSSFDVTNGLGSPNCKNLCNDLMRI